jgi:hypothetical protein
MTEGRRFGGLPFGGLPFEGLVPWTELAGLAAAGRSLVPDVPAALARTVTEQLIGRRLTAKVDGADIALTLTELDYPADSLRLATGRIGDVRIVAENIDWPERDAHSADAPRPTGTPKPLDGPDAGSSGDAQREANTTDGRPGANRPDSNVRPNADEPNRPISTDRPDNSRPDIKGRPVTTDGPGTDRAGSAGSASRLGAGTDAYRPATADRPNADQPDADGQPGNDRPEIGGRLGKRRPDGGGRLSRRGSDRPEKRNPDRFADRPNPGTSSENRQTPEPPGATTHSDPGTRSRPDPGASSATTNSDPSARSRQDPGASSANTPSDPSARSRQDPGASSANTPTDSRARSRQDPGASSATTPTDPGTRSRQDPGTSSANTPSDPGARSRRDPGASGANPAAARVPLRRVVVLAKDVRLRSLPTPSVIPAEVGLEIFVDGDVVRERVAAVRPGIVATPHHDGLRLRWTRHPGWGHLPLEPTVEPEAVVLTPTTLHIGRWKFRAPKRIRPIVLALPELPKGLRLTGVRAAEGELVLNTVADEWPERLARIPLGDLLSWLTTAALTLTLPRLGTRS